jgi:flagellar assembly protein FliH
LAKTVLKEPGEVRPWHTVVPPSTTTWAPGQSAASGQGAIPTGEGQEALLAAARLEAERIVQQAHQEAGLIREEARRTGLAEGRAEALADDAALREQLRELLTTVGDAYRAFCLDQAPALASLVTEATSRLMQEQLTLEPQRVLTIVQQALEQAVESRDLRLHLHPDDLETVRGYLESPEAALPTDLQVVADPSVERGGCWLETGHGEVDATVSRRLARLAQALDEVG